MNRKIFLILLLILFSLGASVQANVQPIDELQFEDATVFDAVMMLGQRGGVNIVFSGDKAALAGKRITLHLKKADPIKVIEQILLSNGFSFEKQDNLITVSTLAADIGSSAYPQHGQIMRLSYLSPKKISPLLNSMGLGIKTYYEEESNALILEGRDNKLAKARELIQSLDQPLPKVLLKAEVLEVSASGMERLGLFFGSEQSGFSFAVDKDSGNLKRENDFSLVLSALLAEGKAKLLARPSLTVLNGEEAEINIGTRLPFAVPSSGSSAATLWSVEYIDAGVRLKILPYISREKIVTTTIVPEVSSIAEWRTTAAGEFPVLSTRNARTTLAVRDGETIAIAGLISEQERKNNSKIPFLGDLPLLGWLFQYTTNETAKSEVVFLVTPTVIY